MSNVTATTTGIVPGVVYQQPDDSMPMYLAGVDLATGKILSSPLLCDFMMANCPWSIQYL